MVTQLTDVLVIGAGALGASCTFHLANRGVQVLTIDQFDGPAEGSTGRCFASVRGQWADDLNISVSWRCIQTYRDFPEIYGTDVGYVASGYLFAVPQTAWPAQLEAVARQRAHGVPVDILTLDEANAITPMVTEGLAGATWGPADGAVDPHAVTTAYMSMAKVKGARSLFGSGVRQIERVGDVWRVTAGSHVIEAATIVNAAGGWSGDVGRLVGLDVPVRHSLRNVFATAPRAIDRSLPMTIDLPSGSYLRSEGERLLFGGVAPPHDGHYTTEVTWSWVEEILTRAIPRFPWLADLPLDRTASWGGTYEMSPDSQGILGPDPDVPHWYNACGFSGHGFMQAPMIGEIVGHEITSGPYDELDVSPLRIERFRGNARTNAMEMVF